MTWDIFDFWSEVAPSDRIHPRDRYALDRMEHKFDLRCLPGCFMGPLRTAPVVLLYLSPGWNQGDVDEADKPETQARYAESRRGRQLLPGPDDHRSAWRWWSSRTSRLGEWPALRGKVAILNICGYKSESFADRHALAALPSCRASVDWAQCVLFPQAERGERVVICLRSAAYWSLGKRARYGEGLFVPAATRGGHMRGSEDHAAAREAVVKAARAGIANS